MAEVEIPSYFLCPISLQIMRDPVTLLTGITYDRDSIERWIFSGKHNTCPATKQYLPNFDLTPNHTLRRLIQAWCVLNSSDDVERFPTPKPPVDKAQIAKLLDDARLPHLQLGSLRKLKDVISESERNRLCVEATPGVVDILASIINNNSSSSTTSAEEGILIGDDDVVESTNSRDEALTILYLLQLSQQHLLDLTVRNGDFIESLTSILQQSNYKTRAYATLLLKSILAMIAPDHLSGFREELFQEVVGVLRDRISHQANKAALQVLAWLCPWGTNRIKAANAGAVPVLVELLLLDQPERRVCELVLVVLDRVCGCAEGRVELVGHAAGIAMVSKKILRVSEAASERGVKILNSVARFSATTAVLQEMLEIGVVSKLCLVLQVDCGMKTKEKAREILRLHSRVWKKSPCLSSQFLISYPPS